MKVNKEAVLFSVLTGSHLYGTASEKSDYDYKAVCLPALDDLLLNKKVTNRKEKPEGLRACDKMVAGETETEYLPFQVFLDDFFNGQTYALEVAFAVAKGKHVFDENAPAPEGMGATAQWWFWKYQMGAMIEQFLTKNVKKMVGYAVAQSQLYGLKTQRYTSITEVLRVINQYGFDNAHHLFASQEKHTLNDVPDLVEKLLALPHVKRSEVLNAVGGSQMAPALDICGKQFPLTNKVETVVKSLEKRVCSYGDRVKEFDGEGVDWKALSHAIRITEQVIELSETGKLAFPRPNAEFLRAVKNGQCPLDVATAYLDSIFEKVDAAVESSVLHERTPELEEKFREWKVRLLRQQYDITQSF
jgi:hypothetical protein